MQVSHYCLSVQRIGDYNEKVSKYIRRNSVSADINDSVSTFLKCISEKRLRPDAYTHFFHFSDSGIRRIPCQGGRQPLV